MDLALYFRVLWRFRVLVAVGLVLAIALAALSFTRVHFNGREPALTYRQNEKWQSTATLLITQEGFPLGNTQVSPQSDPNRFSAFASVYARLALSDAVRRLMLREGPINGVIQSDPVTTTPTSDFPLPMIAISALSKTRSDATDLSRRASTAFRDYIQQQQRANQIPKRRRVVVTEIARPLPSQALLIKGRSKTMPIIVFLAVMTAAVGLAFVLENMRPRIRVVEGSDEQATHQGVDRRSA